MPVYTGFNLATQGRGGQTPNATTNYYSGLNRPNPVGNQLGNNTQPANQPTQPSAFDGGGWQQGQSATPYLQQFLNGRNPYGRSGFNIENSLAGSHTGSNQFGDPRLAQYGYSFGAGAGSESGSENAWRGNGTMGLDQRGLVNRNGTSYAQVGESLDRIIDPTKVIWDDEFGMLTDPSNINMPERALDKYAPAVVAAMMGLPVAAHAGALASFGIPGAEAASVIPEVATGGSTLGTTGIPGGVASGVAPAVPGAGGTITGVGGLPAASVGGGTAVPFAGTAAPSLAAGAGAVGSTMGPVAGPVAYEGAGAGATAAGTGGGMTTGQMIQAGGSLVGTVANAIGNRQNAQNYNNTINGLVERADTWGPENRQRAIDRIWQLYNDPSSIENTPGYEFARQQGEQGVQRAAAGRGYFRSPNMLFDLSKFNQGLATRTYDSEMNRLMTMAGVNNNPASAAQIGAQGAQNTSSMNRTSLTSALAAGGTFLDWLSGLNFG